jgi:hypothetical protein
MDTNNLLDGPAAAMTDDRTSAKIDGTWIRNIGIT